MERLQKVIANYGYCSRREAEKLISAKKVYVNNTLVTELGTKVSSSDLIMINGVTINNEITKKYFILNKPRSVVSSVKDDKGRITVVDLINTKERVYPIGRLDYDTTGLILLTNDGDFANHLMHPSNNFKKTYIAKLEGNIDGTAIHRLKKGVVIGERVVDVVRFKIGKKDFEKNTTMIELTIIEGRNHIVKKVFEKLGYPVIKLTRTNYGHLSVDKLKSGEYRELSIKEVKKFYA